MTRDPLKSFDYQDNDCAPFDAGPSSLALDKANQGAVFIATQYWSVRASATRCGLKKAVPKFSLSTSASRI